MTEKLFVEKFEELVSKVQGVEMSVSDLIREMEITFLGFGKAFSDDFLLDTVIKLWTLVDANEEDEDFNPIFHTMIATVNCINVGDKIKPVLLTYSKLM